MTPPFEFLSFLLERLDLRPETEVLGRDRVEFLDCPIQSSFKDLNLKLALLLVIENRVNSADLSFLIHYVLLPISDTCS